MKIKYFLVAFFTMATIFSSTAQYSNAAYTYSNWGLTGSARMQGMGGSYSSLGADATNAAGNPAGLGFYNRSEFSITPFINSNSANSTYQDTQTNTKNNNFSIGQAALVIHSSGVGSRRKSSAFAITYSKQAYLPSNFNYVGTKAKSSMEDYFAERANSVGATGNQLIDLWDTNPTGTNSIFSFDANNNPYPYDMQLASMAYHTLLIEPNAGNPNSSTFGRGDNLPNKQSGDYKATGAVSQLNIAYGANYDDKVYIGFGLGIATIKNDYTSHHREDFTNGEVFNNFTFSDRLATSGTGINLSAGGIFKASENLQVGVNVISPTWYSMSETYDSGLNVDVNKLTNLTFPLTINLDPSNFEYSLRTPLRANFGATYFIGKTKRGQISADAEYVGYGSMKISTQGDASFNTYQKSLIKSTYNDVMNFKVGGEYRINDIRVRGGINYRPDPYKITDGLDRSQTIFTAGVGYRISTFFVDFAGVFGQSKSAFTPYAIANPANYASVLNSTKTNNFVLSVGTFF